jgi:hypothetical protein
MVKKRRKVEKAKYSKRRKEAKIQLIKSKVNTAFQLLSRKVNGTKNEKRLLLTAEVLTSASAMAVQHQD